MWKSTFVPERSSDVLSDSIYDHWSPSCRSPEGARGGEGEGGGDGGAVVEDLIAKWTLTYKTYSTVVPVCFKMLPSMSNKQWVIHKSLFEFFLKISIYTHAYLSS